ncbi:MAG: bifunctional 2-polyprenyl-6-hydroxyphenol methylase/3-demethylubiquinol 3-O-methyltransferase UbiG [Pseudomonadota bacterium]
MLRKDRLNPSSPAKTSDTAEIDKFNALADEWWRPNGKFKVVHRFNACRVAYLIDELTSFASEVREDISGSTTSDGASRPLGGLKIIDVGCGAGLVSEPLAAAGAEVFAIDAAQRNIDIAARHAHETGVEIRYENATPEQLGPEHTGAYDVAISLEVVEHVADLSAFLASVADLVRPGGRLIIGTLNRTPKSFALGIVGAEYVLQLLPRGTHDWRKFVKPSELAEHLAPKHFEETTRVGVSMNPISWAWSITTDDAVNYLVSFEKRAKIGQLPEPATL